MKRKEILIVILAILAVAVIVFIVTYKIKPINYARVELSTDNIIQNKSTQAHLDTVVSIGMEALGIAECVVIIKDMPDQLKNGNDPGTSDRELKAAIFGSGELYQIYVDPSVDKLEAITIIAHELIHLRQYMSEDLIILDGKTGLVEWKGEKMETLNIQYESRPWEMEAFDEQKDLSSIIKSILLPEE